MSSKIKTAQEVSGHEFDWLAVDMDGCIALFSTAGAGYAPAEFLQDTNAFDSAIDEILAGAATTVARFSPQLAPQYVNTWKLMAERGLFAFDCDPSGGHYRLVAVPALPILTRELSESAARIAERIKLSIRFSDLEIVTEAQIRGSGV